MASSNCLGMGEREIDSRMSTLNFTERLMLLSSCIHCNEEKQKEIVALVKDNSIDWNYFVSRAQDTLLAPVIYRFFSSRSEFENLVPSEVLMSLRNLYNTILHSNLRLAGGFDFVLKEMEKKNIKAIALKGMDVIHNLYSDFGVRQTSDIDLLFLKGNAILVRDLFLDLNFSCQYYMPSKALEITNHPSPYKFFNDVVSIDFHIGLDKVYESAKVPIEEVLDRAFAKGVVSSGCYYTLEPNDNFIYLTLHLSEHFYSFDCKLVSFLDLVELIVLERIQWEAVVERSRSWNSFQTMSEMLFLVNCFFDVEIPDEILKEVSEEKRESLKSSFVILLKESREELRTKFAFEGSTGFNPIAHLTIRDKLKYLFYRTFPDKLYLKSKYKQNVYSHLILWLIHFLSITGIAIRTFARKLVK